VPETAPTRPINPYGRSKLITEWMLEDVAASAAARGFKQVILRYFNVAGRAWMERWARRRRTRRI
jgi:UDP-glucose 4-epimerase